MDRAEVVGRLARQYARLEEPDGAAVNDATRRPPVRTSVRSLLAPTKGSVASGAPGQRRSVLPKALPTTGCQTLAQSAPAATMATGMAALESRSSKVLQAFEALEFGRQPVASVPAANLRKTLPSAPAAASPIARSSSTSSASFAARRAAYQTAVAQASLKLPRASDGKATVRLESKENFDALVESLVLEPGMNPSPSVSGDGADDQEDAALDGPVTAAAKAVLTDKIAARLLAALKPSSSDDTMASPSDGAVPSTAVGDACANGTNAVGSTPNTNQEDGNTYLSLDSEAFDGMTELARGFMSLSEQVSHDLHKAARTVLSGEGKHAVDPGLKYKLLSMMRRRVAEQAVDKAREKFPISPDHEIVTMKRVKLNGDLLVGDDETEVTILTGALSKHDVPLDVKSGRDPPGWRQQFRVILEAALYDPGKVAIFEPTPDSLEPTEQEKAILRLTPKTAYEDDSSDDEREAPEKEAAAAAVGVVGGLTSTSHGPTSIEKLLDLVPVNPSTILEAAKMMRPGKHTEKTLVHETLKEIINQSAVSDDGNVSEESTMMEEFYSVDYSHDITREVTLESVDYTRDGTFLADDEATFDRDESKDEFTQQASFLSASLVAAASDGAPPVTPTRQRDFERNNKRPFAMSMDEEVPPETHSHTSGSSTEVTANAGDSRLYTTFTAGNASPVSFLPLNNSLLPGVNSTLPSVTLFIEGDTAEGPSLLFGDNINVEFFPASTPMSEDAPALTVLSEIHAGTVTACSQTTGALEVTRTPFDLLEKKSLSYNEETLCTTKASEAENPETQAGLGVARDPDGLDATSPFNIDQPLGQIQENSLIIEEEKIGRNLETSNERSGRFLCNDNADTMSCGDVGELVSYGTESREDVSSGQRKSRSSNTTNTRKSRSKEISLNQKYITDNKSRKARERSRAPASKAKKSKRTIKNVYTEKDHDESLAAGSYVVEMMRQELSLLASDFAAVYDEISQNNDTSKSSCSWLRCW